ncbi:hypothetical protein MCHIJ_16860 [Mycolicibacterium chitae]|uniref:Uncharacterized protein n=2 Tax=Mycolicibacterium TaxID=1866885 RepID=A0A3S4RI66_MYCCI|nr:hypothetical protein [Mycolicibacterium chitae]MCV7108368.1 hypothetical protein [Mycolicibacterium chitae]BBZ02249.1 hypothetical protein MCHIJ_16860 [Mycolicibacterium chitae]VEG44462.1 Uncharacterised protein [Mycolicibacterium chitae]
MSETETLEVEEGVAAVAAEPTAAVAVITHDRAVAIRNVFERQVLASQEVSTELISATTDIAAAVADAVSAAFGAVEGGATLPAALAQSGEQLQARVTEAGSRARSVVGDYLGGRAVLPNAVAAGFADVAGSLIRAQGGLASTAVNSAFDLAAVAVRGGDLRATFGQEIDELSTAADLARDRVASAVSAARTDIGDAAYRDERAQNT